MDQILQLYGALILSVFSFVLPILSILLSLFPEGTKALASKYENEKKQSDENILKEIKKRDSGEGLDYVTIGKTLKTLNKRKRDAELKLEYLRPLKLVGGTSVPLLVALIGVFFALSLSYIYSIILVIISSLIAFVCSIYIIYISLAVLVEVSELNIQNRKNNDDKVIELLSTLVEEIVKGKDGLFISTEKIYIDFYNKKLSPSSTFEFAVNKKYDIPVSIVNSSDTMAKNIEAGLTLPKDFLVEKTSNMNVYTGEESQIIRFNKEFIQANEKNQQGKIGITFLKSDTYVVDAFIKGENLKPKYFKFNIKIID
jgi:hypothetical protein